MNGVKVIEEKDSTTLTVPLPTSKLVKQVLLTPGEVVSMSIHLNQKSTFCKHSGLNGKTLMPKVLEDITQQKLGEVETFNISTNKTKVISHLITKKVFRGIRLVYVFHFCYNVTLQNDKITKKQNQQKLCQVVSL